MSVCVRECTLVFKRVWEGRRISATRTLSVILPTCLSMGGGEVPREHLYDHSIKQCKQPKIYCGRRLKFQMALPIKSKCNEQNNCQCTFI